MKIRKAVSPFFIYSTTILLAMGLTCLCNHTHAQQYLMSSVGNLPGSTSNSDAIYFKGNIACIKLESGLSTFNTAKGTSEFNINCDIKEQINTLGIQLFPIPAITTTRLKFLHIPPSNELFNISIWNTEGGMITNRKETGQTIYQGINLDLSSLNPGTYILKVASSHYIDALKFIKAN